MTTSSGEAIHKSYWSILVLAVVDVGIKVVKARKTNNEVNSVKCRSPSVSHLPILKAVVWKARYGQRFHKRSEVAEEQNCKPK